MAWNSTRRILERINTLEHHLHHIARNIMSALDDLRTEVAETKTVAASAVVLLQGLKVALDEAIATGDPAALTALSAELDESTKALSDAVTANTPAPKTPTP